MSISPPSPNTLPETIDRVIFEFLEQSRQQTEAIHPSCTALADSVIGLSRGGKRLRGTFCYWGWRGAGQEPDQNVITASAALEIFHTWALIHDDVMDHSDTRRGQPTVHRRFTAEHTTQTWVGDAESFGVASAILAGTLALSWSNELLSRCSASPGYDHARQLFYHMSTEVMCGQYLDVREQHLPVQDEPEAWQRAQQILHSKSARYTVEAPLLIGGALAGADEQLLDSYRMIGLPLGTAFQLRDDLLGVFGDPAQTGKPAGDDIREGKHTMLVLHALKRASSTERTFLMQVLGHTQATAADIAQAQALMVRTGAQERVEEHIDNLAQQARRALEVARLNTPTHAALLGLITAVTDRDF